RPQLPQRSRRAPREQLPRLGQQLALSQPRASIERYFTTIPHEDRMDAARRIVQHISENIGWIGLFYQTEPDLVANRLANVPVPKSSGSSRLWNIHEWDIR